MACCFSRFRLVAGALRAGSSKFLRQRLEMPAAARVALEGSRGVCAGLRLLPAGGLLFIVLENWTLSGDQSACVRDRSRRQAMRARCDPARIRITCGSTELPR